MQAIIDHVSEPDTRDISVRELSTKLIDVEPGSKKYLDEVVKLDNRLRYQLNQMAEQGLLVVNKEPHGTRHFKRYAPNPVQVICYEGITWILSNPLTIMSCNYHEECGGVCGEDFPQGCRTYREAPQEVKNLIDKYWSKL